MAQQAETPAHPVIVALSPEASNSLLDSILGWLRGPTPSPQLSPRPQFAPPPQTQFVPPQPSVHPAPRPAPASRQLPYGRLDRLLTVAEGDFSAVLQQALPPEHLLFAQVRLANLVRVQP